MTATDHFKHHDLLHYAKESSQQRLSDFPLNQADIALLTEIFYLPFHQLITSDLDRSKGLSLNELYSLYPAKAQHQLSEFDLAREARVELLQRLALSTRFEDLLAYGFRQKIDQKKEEHFSTVIFEVADDFKLLVFRGTDSNLEAWQKDFSLGYLKENPAHKHAKNYLQQVLEADKSPVLLAGHARGANLALHAACQSSRPRSIQQVYLFDPLALSQGDVQASQKADIVQKCQVFQPQSSFVERSLESPLQTTIISSGGIGLMQHLLLVWSVSETGNFITSKSPSSLSLKIEGAIRHFFKVEQSKPSKIDVKSIFSKLIKPDQKEQVANMSKQGSRLLMDKAQPLVQWHESKKNGLVAVWQKLGRLWQASQMITSQDLRARDLFFKLFLLPQKLAQASQTRAIVIFFLLLTTALFLLFQPLLNVTIFGLLYTVATFISGVFYFRSFLAEKKISHFFLALYTIILPFYVLFLADGQYGPVVRMENSLVFFLIILAGRQWIDSLLTERYFKDISHFLFASSIFMALLALTLSVFKDLAIDFFSLLIVLGLVYQAFKILLPLAYDFLKARKLIP